MGYQLLKPQPLRLPDTEIFCKSCIPPPPLISVPENASLVKNVAYLAADNGYRC